MVRVRDYGTSDPLIPAFLSELCVILALEDPSIKRNIGDRRVLLRLEIDPGLRMPAIFFRLRKLNE
jgi:hypothetical protein